MAATISTDTTLRADFLIYEAELDRLQDAADFSGDSSVGLHTAIWTEIQRDLRKRTPPILEADLSDSSELQHAAHLLVVARLYSMSDIEEDQIAKEKWYAKYRKEMRQVNLTVGGTEQLESASETAFIRG
jgi:hypothetical protein